jgi:3-methyl-2-oxobutanoate hydroxymethyltransferase
VVAGERTTLGVTLEQTILHTRYVSRGARYSLVVADLPFLTYQISVEEAVRSAGRCIQEGRAAAVKLEGGVRVRPQIEAIVGMGVPVLAHVGLTPQSVHRFGGMRVQGRDEAAREAILQDANSVAEAGAFAVVVEGVPRSLGRQITERVPIPTIGIGAGPDCDGQILVTHDMVGLGKGKVPSFVKRYRELGEELRAAAAEYGQDVRDGTYPGEQYGYDD